MKKIVESVGKNIRPKSEFSCIDCPYSSWNSGMIEYGNTGIVDIQNEEFLDCYCHKKYMFTYDSTNNTLKEIEGESKKIVFYKNISLCEDKIMAVNKVLNEKR